MRAMRLMRLHWSALLLAAATGCGSEVVAGNTYTLRATVGEPEGLIIGGNIGKNKFTPNERAINDYIECFEQLYPVVDYFVVNVSSPNTPGLRELQDKKPLLEILSKLR